MDQWLIDLLTPIIPTVLLLLGGKWLLIKYDLLKKRREQEIELGRSIREKQYDSVDRLYACFADLMELYRTVDSSASYPSDEGEINGLLMKAIKVESCIDSLIIKIACEFVIEESPVLESLLGHLRQSVQVWRESICSKQRLPFNSSHQEDYTRFKETFSAVAAYMVFRIHQERGVSSMRLREARDLVMNVFSNKYEHESYTPIQDRGDWITQLYVAKL